MAGVLGKFQVQHGIGSVRVVARDHQLTRDCSSDAEIDTAIEMLKDDLDACAREMKRLVILDQRGSLFEGWPSAKDQMLGS